MDSDEYLRMAENSDRHWWYRGTRALLRQLIAQNLSPSDSHLFLDAAGGTGATGGWLGALAPTVNADFEQIALQISAKRCPGYVPVRADLNHLPFTDNSFSLVVCTTALYHRLVPSPAAVVSEFSRITRPGGLVCLMEPAGQWLWRSHDEVTHAARRFGLRELEGLAVGAGLDVVKRTGAYTFLVLPAAIMAKFEKGESASDVGRNQSGLFGILGALAGIERLILRRFRLSFGLSAVVLARKPM